MKQLKEIYNQMVESFKKSERIFLNDHFLVTYKSCKVCGDHFVEDGSDALAKHSEHHFWGNMLNALDNRKTEVVQEHYESKQISYFADFIFI